MALAKGRCGQGGWPAVEFDTPGPRQAKAEFDPSKRYEELRHLGSGAFGSAELVRRRSDGHRFVAKKCNISGLDEKQRNLCLKEIALLRMVQHDCIAEVVDFLWASSSKLSYWLVLKYYPGGDVQNQIDECRNNSLELPEGKIRNWTTQLCMALEHVHHLRIIHRDVKGSNLFITGVNNIVLGDFGVSKQLSSTATKAMTSIGSPVFMAPEWWDGRGGCERSDMWSVGVVLYELITLRRPFEAGNMLSLVHKVSNEEPEALPEDCDENVSRLVGRLLSKDPAMRPSAAEALKWPCLQSCNDLLRYWRDKLEAVSDRRLQEEARAEDRAAGKALGNAQEAAPEDSEEEQEEEEDEEEGEVPTGMVNLVSLARMKAARTGSMGETEKDEEEEEEESTEEDAAEEGASGEDCEHEQDELEEEEEDEEGPSGQVETEFTVESKEAAEEEQEDRMERTLQSGENEETNILLVQGDSNIRWIEGLTKPGSLPGLNSGNSGGPSAADPPRTSPKGTLKGSNLEGLFECLQSADQDLEATVIVSDNQLQSSTLNMSSTRAIEAKPAAADLGAGNKQNVELGFRGTSTMALLNCLESAEREIELTALTEVPSSMGVAINDGGHTADDDHGLLRCEEDPLNVSIDSDDSWGDGIPLSTALVGTEALTQTGTQRDTAKFLQAALLGTKQATATACSSTARGAKSAVGIQTAERKLDQPESPKEKQGEEVESGEEDESDEADEEAEEEEDDEAEASASMSKEVVEEVAEAEASEQEEDEKEGEEEEELDELPESVPLVVTCRTQRMSNGFGNKEWAETAMEVQAKFAKLAAELESPKAPTHIGRTAYGTRWGGNWAVDARVNAGTPDRRTKRSDDNGRFITRAGPWASGRAPGSAGRPPSNSYRDPHWDGRGDTHTKFSEDLVRRTSRGTRSTTSSVSALAQATQAHSSEGSRPSRTFFTPPPECSSIGYESFCVAPQGVPAFHTSLQASKLGRHPGKLAGAPVLVGTRTRSQLCCSKRG